MHAHRFAALARLAFWLATVCGLLPAAAARASTECELNGQPVNTDNGNTTAGKSGLVRCRDGSTGLLRDERTLRNGNFVGPQRSFHNGVLEREFSVNERGNRDGLAREYAATPGPGNPLLLEETLRDGMRSGIERQWSADGKLKLVRFHGDDSQVLAQVELNALGQPSQLRCGPRALLAPHVDDAAWCGFNSSAPVVTGLYDPAGKLRARVTHERGVQRKFESLWPDGSPKDQNETRADGGAERAFLANGNKRFERVWVNTGSSDRARRVVTLEQEFHESGQMIHERRWTASDAGGTLALEQRWYLNGQLKARDEYSRADGETVVRERAFHDNGKPSSDASWATGGNRYARRALGTHQFFDVEGRLRSERFFDAQGRISRERTLEADGSVKSDDAVFEDGSRKAFSR